MSQHQSLPKALIELTKPSLVIMQVVTLSMGFLLGSPKLPHSWTLFMYAVIGTLLISAGTLALNNCMEKQVDKKMERTKNRVLPAERLSVLQATLYGLTLALVGTAVLYIFVNALTASLAVLTTLLYLLVYTPLKKITWHNTLIGAIPGGFAPLGGWAAATGTITPSAWLLFWILFVWQLPHFFAIAWMYKEDYQKGGLVMLPSLDPTGSRTAFHIIFNTILLIVISLLPMHYGLLHWPYTIGALLLGSYFLLVTLKFLKDRSKKVARKIVLASVVYLPVLLLLMIIDHALYKI